MNDLSNPIFTDENAAREYLEGIRWPHGTYCPHCGETKNVKKLKGKSHRPGLYQCNACRGAFTVTVGTVYEHSKVSLNKWLLATYLLSSSKKGMSAHQLHRMLGVTYKTAWFMFHRIREAMKEDNSGPTGGKTTVAKTDEADIGPHGHEVVNNEGQTPKAGTGDKYRVMALIERDDAARCIHIKDFRTKKEHMKESTVINAIEESFSIFKHGMLGVYQHCGEKHLQRYLHEFNFRHTHRRLSDAERADLALARIEGKRLIYRKSRG